MEKVIESFSVKYIQILDENGKVDEKLMPKISDEMVKKMYELMLKARVFDDYAVKYQRQGRMGTYASLLGQEACQIGSALALGKSDLVFPSFREHGVFLTRGMSMEKLFQFWIGDERGMDCVKKIGIFPVSIPVGSHPLHAVGAGFAFNYLKQKAVSVAYFGDGATSEGDFHEALNFACPLKSKVVFICQNNQFAISVPVKEQTCAVTLAQKAFGYGIEGIQVDGNDVFAVYKATMDALKDARNGRGSTFLELVTFRLGDHTTSDDAKKYRNPKITAEWKKKGPIIRLEKFMLNKKMWNESYKKKLVAGFEKEVSDAFKRAESFPPYSPEEIFEYMYAEKTPTLIDQQKDLIEGKNG